MQESTHFYPHQFIPPFSLVVIFSQHAFSTPISHHCMHSSYYPCQILCSIAVQKFSYHFRPASLIVIEIQQNQTKLLRIKAATCEHMDTRTDAISIKKAAIQIDIWVFIMQEAGQFSLKFKLCCLLK